MAHSHKLSRTLGVCYYPEHWPEDMWAQDAARMAETGLTWVRIGEFAWSRLEARPGQLTFEWLDRAIETLGAAGLKVVLGTPTATPPRWMIDKWPDMLAVDEDGNTRKFGSRRHYCFSHEGYREESARITRIFAERYGHNPHVAAWQTDNEYGCHDTTVSFGACALEGFQKWLAEKYKTVEALNTAWGNIFWSMEYDSFAQVDTPNLTVTEPNPSHVLDFKRYSSDAVVAFNKIQTDILREHSKAPLLHNYMGRTTDFDHYDVGDDLDIASWDSYPLGFLEDRSDQDDAWKHQFMRQGDPDFQAFHHDLYRAVGRGRWWVMEQQPGPVNWAPFNPAPLPGMARLWAWEAFAHGAEAVCYFRWRQAPFAQEQMHAGMLRPDSAAAPALGEAAQVSAELNEFADGLGDVDAGNAPVALVFDYESHWAWQAQPQGQSFDYFRLVFDFYRAARQLGLSIDIIGPNTSDLSGYKAVFAPGLMRVRPDLWKAMEAFKGTIVAGPRSGAKTSDMQIPDNLGPALPRLSCVVEYVESLRDSAEIRLSKGGSFIRWAEVISGDATVVETTEDGAAALLGEDGFFYLAGWLDQEGLKRIIKSTCEAQGVKTISLIDGLRVRDTSDYRFVFNYGASAETFNGKTIEAAGVLWEAIVR